MSEPQITPEIAKGLAQGIAIEGANLRNPPAIGGLIAEAVKLTHQGRGEQALQIMAGEIIPWTKEDLEGGLRENLSSQDRGKDGRKEVPRAGSAERARYDKAKDTAEACLEYLKSGTGEIPSALTQTVVDYLAQNPVFRDLLYDQQGQLRQDDAKVIANYLLRQPEVRRRLHQLFTERLDPTRRLGHAAEVDRLKRELEVLSRQVILESEDEIIRNQILQKQNEISAKVIDLKGQQKYPEYLAKKSTLRDIERLISDIESGKINTQSPDWGSRVLPLTPNITNRTDLNVVRQELFRFQAEIQNTLATTPEFQTLQQKEDEISQLQSQIQQLEQRRTKATSEENRKLLADYYEKKDQLREAEALLTAERIKYASEVIGIPAEAVKSYLDEALGSAAQHYKDQAKIQAEREEGEQKRLLENALEKLGQRLGRKADTNNGETRFIPDKTQARRLLVMLMQPGGVEKFMEEVCRDERTLMIYGLSQEEAKAILAKKGDTEFMKNTGVELAKKVLADYLLAGGRLSRDDIIAMGNSEWLDSLINDGLKIAQEKRQQIENLVGKGVLTKLDEIKKGKSNPEWLAANWWKLGLGILGLLLLLGLGVSKVLH
jgi:hypothetical protein